MEKPRARRCEVCRKVVGHLVPNGLGGFRWEPKDNYAGHKASGYNYRCVDHPKLEVPA